MAISDPTRKVLWTRAHDRCSYPGCPQRLTVDQVDVGTGAPFVTVVGQQAHVRSSKLGGPRHDPDYPKDRLDDYENLILLCGTHHTMIDANGGAGYEVDELVKMRTSHERQQERQDRIDKVTRGYLAQQYDADDKVMFEQVDLHGPSVDAMFVDVPLGCRSDVKVADLLRRIAADHPGDREATEGADGQVVTGAAQALLHPDWVGNALLVGGPGQGKSTLLQYVCQFHRARYLGRDTYKGTQQQLEPLTDIPRAPLRLDLRKYAEWADIRSKQAQPARGRSRRKANQNGTDPERWPSIEEYIAWEIQGRSAGRTFDVDDLATFVSTRPVLIALDGLDEVAKLKSREKAGDEIVAMATRLGQDARDLTVLVATRPGGTSSALWSASAFPRLNLQRLSQGLRLQYLQHWSVVAGLAPEATEKLQKTFMDNQHVPHIRELAAYPMQLAILLHLLYRRQLLPQQRTELYREYLKTFLDREEREDKEPLLDQERQIIEDIHAILAWHLQTAAEEGATSGSIGRDDLLALLRDHLAGREGGQKLAEKLFSAFTSRVLCLVEREAGLFQFEVQPLREYFAARYVFENAPIRGTRNSRDDCLNALLVRPYWSNVCRFFVGMFSKGEVRGIRHNLRELGKKGDRALHPMLRSTAALFLDDRTYEGQNDEPIQEIVDFILDGPGVVLAEDGVLDVSGSTLLLSERAGRYQAVRHLKARLVDEQSPAIREAAAASLRRHAVQADNLLDWWWQCRKPTTDWLQTGCDLRLLGALASHQEVELVEFLQSMASRTVWITELLQQGGYNGTHDDVAAAVKNELNDGAGDALRSSDRTTSVGRLVEAAIVAEFRPSQVAANRAPADAGRRTRLRRKAHGSLLESMVEATDDLRRRPGADANTQDWQARLVRVSDVWGYGWVLLQAVATVPIGVDVSGVADAVKSSHPDLASALVLEAAVRENRGTSDWWRRRLEATEDDLARRHWIFSLLACARPGVVIDLAGEINGQVDALTPKHFRAMRGTLETFSRLSVARALLLQDPLRLNQVELSPRALWLMRVVASEGTIVQVDKRLAAHFTALLEPGMGDMRELVMIAGKNKTIKFDQMRGTRPLLPVGGWASNVKLGSMRASLASDVLGTPADWPGDLVQRAVEQLEGRITSGLQSISIVARADRWFLES